ncbi:general transcription factor II-I repeat domain-containing protein 2B-like [Oryzias latipes]|uniref:general transcription factor II-I repeat domain-containing protein 2B-like n=1 Tax=Oryzias latipes TaxID=8090 RepID=UPI000CE221DB|nr:general transcription factor II-I repeat domain-containing protein 2B-like [Oryzias latipes]
MREKQAGELTVYHCIIHQEALCGKALKMDHIMNTVTQIVNFIEAKGLNHRQFKSFLGELGADHSDMPHHTEVRWLSRGKVAKRCFELREEICLFMESKGKDTTELRDEKFQCEFAFLCDIMNHLDALNLQLQGRVHVITDMYNAVRAFRTKLGFWESQMQQGNLAHLLSCQVIKEQTATAVMPFARRFANFEAQKCRFELFSNPFAFDVNNAPSNLQMELIELQCNNTFKSKYDSVGAAQFPPCLPDTLPELRAQAAQMLSVFGSTYLCASNYFRQ